MSLRDRRQQLRAVDARKSRNCAATSCCSWCHWLFADAIDAVRGLFWAYAFERAQILWPSTPNIAPCSSIASAVYEQTLRVVGH
jgi:hypothetical protein